MFVFLVFGGFLLDGGVVKWSPFTSLFLKISYNPLLSGHGFGEIVGLDYNGASYVNEDDSLLFLKWGDNWICEGEIVEESSDSLVIRAKNLGDIPVEVVILYKVYTGFLFIQYRFVFKDTIDEPSSLELFYTPATWDSLEIECQAGKVYNLCLENIEKHHLSLNHIFWFKDSAKKLGFFIPNPFHFRVRLNDPSASTGRNRFSMSILVSEGPYGTWKEPVGPPLHSVIPAQETLTVSLNLMWEEQDFYFFISPFPDGFQQVIMMMYDNLPFEGYSFVVPRHGHDERAPVGKYMVRILEEHPKMKAGWLILADGINDEDDIVNPSEKFWWHVHSKRRFATEAPKEYLEWLRNLEQDICVYGYEKQVRLGYHGYHHTPPWEFERKDGISPPNWEFQYYDPAGHDSAFAIIKRDNALMGLTEKSMKFFRPPGFKSTQSTIRALAKYGFIIYEPKGCYIDRLEPEIGFFLFPEGKLWLINSHWCGDRTSRFNTYEFMGEVLKIGKYCLTYAHPNSMFHDEAQYEYSNQIFTTAEKNYPFLGYLFPNEFGFYADSCYNIRIIPVKIISGYWYEFIIKGKLPKDVCFVFLNKNKEEDFTITFDEKTLKLIYEDGERMFYALPEGYNKDTLHTLEITSKSFTDLFKESEIFYPTIFSRRKAPLCFFLKNKTTLSLTVYDINGKKIIEINSEGEKQIFWNLMDRNGKGVSSGVYFIKFNDGKSVHIQKLIVIP